MPDDETSEALRSRSGIVLQTVQRLLKPLVRFLIAHQVTYPQVAELLKRLYVRAALDHFALPERRLSDSRVSLLTGLHRKDVKRLQAAPPDAREVPASIALGAQIVTRWSTEPAYLDRRGRPRPLRRDTGGEDDVSFDTLVESVSRDIGPRAVLDELVRLGVVEIDDDDRVHLQSEAFVPRKAFDEKAFYMGRNLHDHIAAAVHNLEGDGPPFVERNVHYGSLTPGSAAELTELSRELGMDAIREVNRRAAALKKRDAGQPHADRRISFGVYFFEDASEPRASEDRGDDD